MEPCGQQKFQEGTAAMDRSPVNGVCYTYRFWCPECQQARPQAGREAIGHKQGFRCAGCKSARRARLAAKRAAHA